MNSQHRADLEEQAKNGPGKRRALAILWALDLADKRDRESERVTAIRSIPLWEVLCMTRLNPSRRRQGP